MSEQGWQPMVYVLVNAQNVIVGASLGDGTFFNPVPGDCRIELVRHPVTLFTRFQPDPAAAVEIPQHG